MVGDVRLPGNGGRTSDGEGELVWFSYEPDDFAGYSSMTAVQTAS